MDEEHGAGGTWGREADGERWEGRSQRTGYRVEPSRLAIPREDRGTPWGRLACILALHLLGQSPSSSKS